MMEFRVVCLLGLAQGVAELIAISRRSDKKKQKIGPH
jgi:hypothetical protein